MQSTGLSQALANEVDLSLWRGNAALRFFLESVQNINRFGEAGRIDRSLRSASMLSNDLHDRRTSKAFQ